jgi:hypothetical protein
MILMLIGSQLSSVKQYRVSDIAAIPIKRYDPQKQYYEKSCILELDIVNSMILNII